MKNINDLVELIFDSSKPRITSNLSYSCPYEASDYLMWYEDQRQKGREFTEIEEMKYWEADNFLNEMNEEEELFFEQFEQEPVGFRG